MPTVGQLCAGITHHGVRATQTPESPLSGWSSLSPSVSSLSLSPLSLSIFTLPSLPLWLSLFPQPHPPHQHPTGKRGNLSPLHPSGGLGQVLAGLRPSLQKLLDAWWRAASAGRSQGRHVAEAVGEVLLWSLWCGTALLPLPRPVTLSTSPCG